MISVFILVCFVKFAEFYQVTLQAFIKALNMQFEAFFVYIISFYILSLSSMYFLTFKIGYHDDEESGLKKEGLGLAGLWIAIILA